MKKVTLALSVLSMMMSTAMATTPPEIGLDPSGQGTHAIELTASFQGTAMPCLITEINSPSSLPIIEADIKLTHGTDATEIVIHTLKDYKPYISATTLSTEQVAVKSGMGITDVLELVTGAASNLGETDSIAVDTTLDSNLQLMSHQGAGDINYYSDAIYANLVAFKPLNSNYTRLYRDELVEVTTEITITCVQEP